MHLEGVEWIERGLNVSISAVDIPIREILKALRELQAMPPTPCMPQEVRRNIEVGPGKPRCMSVDLVNVDPREVQATLELELSKH